MRFKGHPPRLMDLPEMEQEHQYLTKRLYRLEKLKRMGKDVEPDLSNATVREDVLDVAIRERRRGMEEIPT